MRDCADYHRESVSCVSVTQITGLTRAQPAVNADVFVVHTLSASQSHEYDRYTAAVSQFIAIDDRLHQSSLTDVIAPKMPTTGHKISIQ